MPAKKAKPQKEFRQEFGAELRKILKEQGLGVREFGILAGFDAGFLAGVLGAKRPPPLTQFPTWVEILKLRGDQKQTLLDYGYLTHCPKEVWDMVESLKAENLRLKQRLGDEKAISP